MLLHFEEYLLEIIDPEAIIIFTIIKHYNLINKEQILKFYNKITPNKLNKIIRTLIKNKLIFYGKNYTLEIYREQLLERNLYKFGTKPLQMLPSIKKVGVVNEANLKTLSIYKDYIKNKNNIKNKNKEKENNIKNIVKEKENLILPKPNNFASKKIGYKIYDLNELLQIISSEIPSEYITNLFEHFESQNFKSSGTLITNLKTRIELYFKKNWYSNFLPKKQNETNSTNTTNSNFEQRVQNIKRRNEQLRTYAMVNNVSDEVGVVKKYKS